MFVSIPFIFLLLGVVLLIISLQVTARVRLEQQHPGLGWGIVYYLILFFIIAYIGMLFLLSREQLTLMHYTFSLILVTGSVFVFLVSKLSQISIRNSRRIASLDRHRALHDHLTDLPNRLLLMQSLEAAISSSRKTGLPLAVIVMDLDRFKEINDTLGHFFGDMLLQKLAPKLRASLRESDLVARLGGDEFAVLLPDAEEGEAVTVTEKILEVLRQPFHIEGHTLDVDASIGIALFPKHADSSDALLQKADVAMYVAKHSQLDYALYDQKQDQYSISRLVMTGELRNALEREQLVLHYQPKVDLRHRQVRGMEALVRWQHPVHGLVMPDEFIPLAEQAGLIKPLTLWVLNAALRQQADWRSSGFPLEIAVNLSVKNLQDPDLYEQVKGRLEAWEVEPRQLILEVTESATMQNPEFSMEVIRRLHGLGVRFSIDDFGTGYSSLSYLKQLPAEEIKIDKSFVMGMNLDENDAVIVRSTIDLAHNMGRTVIAEGVESRDIQEVLDILGCDMVQGYYIARPMPPETSLEWLETTHWKAKV